MLKALILATALLATFAAAEVGTASPPPASARAATVDYVATSSSGLQPGTRGPVIQL